MKTQRKPKKRKGTKMQVASLPRGVGQRDPKITKFIKKKEANNSSKPEGTITAGTKNKDGYPLSKCTYFDEVDDWYFIPKNYGVGYANNHRFHDRAARPCVECRLCPCMALEYYEAITVQGMNLRSDRDLCGPGKICSTLKPDERLKDRTVCEILLEVARLIMKSVHGKRRANKMGIPKCVRDDIWYFADLTNGDSDSEYDSSLEEENEF